MKKIVLGAALLMLVMATVGSATVLTVSVNPGSAQYTTILAAYNAATNGDTILIGPGTYNNQIIHQKRLHYIGAGWDVCTMTSGGHCFYMQTAAANGTVIEGLRIQEQGGYNVYMTAPVDSITLRRCLLSSVNSNINMESGRLYVEDCILLHQTSGDLVTFLGTATTGNCIFRNTVFALTTPNNSSNALQGIHGGVIEIYNCVFVNMNTPFNLTGTPQVVGLNNIFFDWTAATGYGPLPAGSVFEYTAAGGGQPAFPAGFNNNITLGANNPFVNYNTATNYIIGTSDLHLNNTAGGLMCVDTGYPSINDLDGSRSDVGLYGGPKPLIDNGLPAYPFAITLTVDPLVEVGDSVGVNSTGRIGPRY